MGHAICLTQSRPPLSLYRFQEETSQILTRVHSFKRDGPNWMDVTMNKKTGPGEIQLVFQRSVRVLISRVLLIIYLYLLLV